MVTNPPFSLFREYVAQLVQYGKKFLIVGSQNAVTYKEIFPLVKDNRMWLGVTPKGQDMLFDVPEDYAHLRSRSDSSPHRTPGFRSPLSSGGFVPLGILPPTYLAPVRLKR